MDITYEQIVARTKKTIESNHESAQVCEWRATRNLYYCYAWGAVTAYLLYASYLTASGVEHYPLKGLIDALAKTFVNSWTSDGAGAVDGTAEDSISEQMGGAFGVPLLMALFTGINAVSHYFNGYLGSLRTANDYRAQAQTLELQVLMLRQQQEIITRLGPAPT